jgi:predicted metal-dependent phosphoesterase TrpH
MNFRSVHPKVVSLDEARSLRDQGWKTADLHVHTLCSPDVLSARSLHPEALYRKARALGMEFVTFTDHDTMDAYEMLGGKREGLVTGVEIKIRDMETVGHTIHINVYDLSQRQFSELEEMAIEGDLCGMLSSLRKSRLPFIYNHPFWFEPGERPNLSAIPEIIKLFPAVEYNMHRIRRKNEITMELAARYGKGLVASTDTHSGMIGQIYTLAKGESFREFFKNILDGKSCIAVADLTKQDFVDEINAWIDLVFSPDLLPGADEYTIGTRYVDGLIRALASETLRGFPRLCQHAVRICHKISNSGIPASLYLRSEGTLMPEIERQLAAVLNERPKRNYGHGPN